MNTRPKLYEKGFLPILRGMLETYVGEQKKDLLVVRYLYRPLSFPLTVPPLVLGITPNQVTLFNFFVLVGACVAIGFGELNATYIGAALYLFLFISDCIDGNIARYLNRRRYYGKIIDGLVDVLAFLVYIAIAVGNVRGGRNVYPPMIELGAGALITISLLVSSYFRARLMFMLGEIRKRTQSARVSAALTTKHYYRSIAKVIIGVYENLGPLGPIIYIAAIATGHVSEFLILYGVIYPSFTIVEILQKLYAYRNILDVPRSTEPKS